MSKKQFIVVVLLIAGFGSALTYESHRQTKAVEAISATAQITAGRVDDIGNKLKAPDSSQPDNGLSGTGL